jgi:hypothetical protein
MSEELGRLLLKALGGLPVEEQGALLAALFTRSASAPGLELLVGLGPDSPVLADVVGAAHELRSTRRAQASGQEPELKVLPVRLPAADYERLRAWSKEHDFSMAVIVRTLVERFLDGQEQKP